MQQTYIQHALTQKRAIKVQEGTKNGPVLYLMNRDQRIYDNHALSFAQSLAITSRQPLIIYFGLDKSQNKYNKRQLSFLFDGLQKLEVAVQKLQIQLIVKSGDFIKNFDQTIKNYSIGTIVTDFSPLRQDRTVLEQLINLLSNEIYQVDAHNIVPCRAASEKKEYAAYTIRPKLNRLLPQYQNPAPAVSKHPYKLLQKTSNIDWSKLTVNSTRLTGRFSQAGENAALKQLAYFVKNRLAAYADLRNDPTENNQSNLSPYLHFGHISSRTILERILTAQVSFASIEQFEDELFIRKELSDNFCFYARDYDAVSSFPEWAQTTIRQHAADIRPFLYPQTVLEMAETNDPLWNAAQLEMITTGKMHGYMRMYWAKKIFKWTESAEQAMEVAVYLNDKYQLDGNDPNGYAGIAWSIGGVHDRAWFEREIFGKIRYMNYNGCKRKFNIQNYINKYNHNNKLELS